MRGVAGARRRAVAEDHDTIACMMKHRIEPTAAAALLIACLVSLSPVVSLSAAQEERGPAGPTLGLDCGAEEELLTDPERRRAWLPRENCREHSVARLEAALASDPRIDAFDIRSGEIGVGEIPPSDRWVMGASPEWSDSPAYVIPVRFEEPLRWEPYIVTWFPEMETLQPTTGRSDLVIAKIDPTPEGFEIHLVARNGARIPAISVAWMAYDTTTIVP